MEKNDSFRTHPCCWHEGSRKWHSLEIPTGGNGAAEVALYYRESEEQPLLMAAEVLFVLNVRVSVSCYIVWTELSFRE